MEQQVRNIYRYVAQLNVQVQSILSLGLTIANRLTQNPEVTVLVIESGQDGQGDPRLTDPAKSVYFFILFFKHYHFSAQNSDVVAATSSDLTWGLVTTNQTVGGLAHNLTVSAFFSIFI